MQKNIVLAHDVGTSSVKSALIDSEGNILNHCTRSYPFHYPKPGWIEQDPEDYWNAISANSRTLAESVDKNQITGIVFTTQAMGIIPMDASGNVLHKNITWVDGRAEEQAQHIMATFGGTKIFKSFLGTEITGKDVIPKLIWLKQNEKEIYKSTHKILDVNGYLRYRATGKIAAEWSGACSYGFNLKKKDWEHLLFIAAGFDRRKLPPLIRSTDVAGTVTKESALDLGIQAGTPVFGGCDDTQSAAVGSGSIGEGEAHLYIGTSAWLGVTTAKSHKFKNGVFCVQSADPQKNLVVGITESAGNNLEWLINQFYQHELKTIQRIDIYKILDEEAAKIPAGSDHLIITPWFLGERSPVSTTTTRGTIFNLSLEHSRGHIVKAMSEGIGFNLRWIAENFQKDFGFTIPGFRLIGGGAQNQQWMQTIADITGRTVTTTNHATMAGTIGAAMCAFVGSGVFGSFSEISKIIRPAIVFTPEVKNKAIYDELFSNYKDIYHSLKGTYLKANTNRF
jgi:xylulokinase